MKQTTFTLLERNDNEGNCFEEILEIGFESNKSIKTAVATARNYNEPSFVVKKVDGYMIEESDNINTTSSASLDEVAEKLGFEMFAVCKFEGNEYIYDMGQVNESFNFDSDTVKVASEFEYPLDVATEWIVNHSLFGIEFYLSTSFEKAYKSLESAVEDLVEELMEDASDEEYDFLEKLRFITENTDDVKGFVEKHNDQIVKAVKGI